MAPRIPDEFSLGGLPGMDSGRRVATYDTTAVGKGLESLGDDVAARGRMGGLAASLTNVVEREEAIKTARADAHFLTGKVELDNSFRDDDQDYQSWGERYKKGIEKLREDAAGMITNPRSREAWTLRRSDDIARGEARIQQLTERRHKIAGVADTNQQLDEVRTAALQSDDEETRAIAIRTGNFLIERARSAGWIDENQAQTLRQKWTTNYATSAVKLMPPEERIGALGGFDRRLAHRESGGVPTRVNQFGYAGLYQFGAPRAADLGFYTPGPNEDLKIWSKTGRNAPGKWSGEFNIPGFPAVKTLQDFLGNADAQKAAYGLHVGRMDEEIEREGLSQYIGKTVGGVAITREGLHAMMHLGGAKGAKRALETDGREAARDANGTSVMDYARMGAKPKRSDLAEFIPPDQREALIEQAGREQVISLRQQEAQRREEAAGLSVTIADDLSSIENTGRGVPDLTAERVSQVFGVEKAREWQEDRARAQRIHAATVGIETLPPNEVEQRLQALEPVPGTPGYVADMAAYRKAEKKAKAFLEARRADPALAVEVFPAVKAARASAQYEGEGERRALAPTSAQAIVAARLAAQSQIGIEEPMAVTRSEARVIARQLRYIGDDDGAAMERFMTTLQRTYGQHTDAVLTSVLQHAQVNRDLSVLATDTLRKLGTGNRPTLVDIEALGNGMDQQVVDDAMRGRAAPAAPAAASQTGQNFRQRAREGRAGVAAQAEQRAAPAAPASAPTPAIQQTLLPDDIRRLEANPSGGPEFDAKYGFGASKKVLEELSRRRAIMQPKGDAR